MLQLRNHLARAAESEIGVDPLFERREAQFFQSLSLVGCERLVQYVGERSPAPQLQCFAQRHRGGGDTPVCTFVPPARDELFELLEVEFSGLDAEGVTRRSPLNPIVAQQPPQP